MDEKQKPSILHLVYTVNVSILSVALEIRRLIVFLTSFSTCNSRQIFNAVARLFGNFSTLQPYNPAAVCRSKNLILEGRCRRMFSTDPCQRYFVTISIRLINWTFFSELLFHNKVTLGSRCSVIHTLTLVHFIYKNQRFSVRYLKKSELLNRLCSFMDLFVCYIRKKVCRLYNV